MIKNSASPVLSHEDRVGRFISLSCTVVFFVFLILAVRYQVYLLDYKAFGDEAETIVAAKMMVAGQKLYSEIFNHHGPLTFFSGYLLESFGSFAVPGHRVPIAILQILAMVSIYFSPLLRERWVRQGYVVVASAVVLLYYSDNFGSMYMYQVIAGLFIVVIMAQYTLPAIMLPQELQSWQVRLGSFLIGCLPFFAITYAPIALLLFLASLRTGYVKPAVVAVIAAVLANLAFLMATGSIAGFLAYHIYLNSQILPLYNGGQQGLSLIFTAFNAATANLASFAVFFTVALAVVRVSVDDSRLPWRSVLIALGASSLLIRGLGLHGVTYYYLALVVPIAFFARSSILPSQARLVLLAVMLVYVYKVSLVFPGDMQRIKSSRNPSTTEFSQLVARFTDKNDKIIAYSFNNHEYIAAGRLPASGYYFYLPWQEKYNEAPRFGVKIDACKQISEYMPKVMLINKWKVWDQFPWETYGGCIQRLLDAEYVQLPGKPYYLRKDIYQGILSDDLAGFSTVSKTSVTYINDLSPGAAGSYKVVGGDAYVVYNITEPSSSIRNLAFELSCLEPRSKGKIPIQIFWRTTTSRFSEAQSFRFDAYQGNNVLDLSKAMEGVSSEQLAQIRMDFPLASTCAVVSPKNVELGYLSK